MESEIKTTIHVTLEISSPAGFQGDEQDLKDLAMESLMAKEEDMKKYNLDSAQGGLAVKQVIE